MRSRGPQRGLVGTALILVTLTGCAERVTERPRQNGGGGTGALTYRPDVQRTLELAGCTSCHEGLGVPMRVVPAPATESEWIENWSEVSARAGDLVARALGSGGHDAVLSSGDAHTAALRSWVAAGGPYEVDSAAPPPGADGGMADNPCSAEHVGGRGIAFCPQIQADLESAGCTGRAACHGARGIPMMVVFGPRTAEQWHANYVEIAARAASPEASLLLAKPLGVGDHLVVLEPDSPVLARWREWIVDGRAEYP